MGKERELLMIDSGNTFTKVAVGSVPGEILELRRVSNEELKGTLQGLSRLYSFRKAVVSSVHLSREELSGLLSHVTDRVVWVDHRVKMPLTIGYDTPETLGSDRIAAAVGACDLFPGKNLIVVDFGTAITIDIVDSGGNFSGGNISPGLATRCYSMHRYTNRLPLVDPVEPTDPIGKKTYEAVSNGAVLGIMFEIEGYIRMFPESKVIFTGGDAIFFAKQMKSAIFVVCNLVFRGLLKIAEIDE